MKNTTTMKFASEEIDLVNNFVIKNKQQLIKERRWFHQHPETAYKEIKTGEYIVACLKSLGISKIQRVAKTGVIAIIDGSLSSKTIACRFNMDALPIEEKTGLKFHSLKSGYSHACGHDFELAWGLLIAKFFSQHKPSGTLKLIFQPAEEGPGDEENHRTGGQFIAEEGHFDVDGIFSLHVEPKLPIRTVSITEGEVTGAAYDFEIELQGKMGHAAKPEDAINPIDFAAELIVKINNLNSNVSAKSIEGDFGVITVSDITTCKSNLHISEEPLNTIPEYSIIKGITRFRDEHSELMIIEGLKKIVHDYKNNLTNIKLTLHKRAVPTLNNPQMVSFIKNTISDFGFSLVERRTKWRDDAGWGSQIAPTAHGFIGVDDGNAGSLHTPYFCPSEKGLEIGLKIFLNSLIQSFNNLKIQ